MCVSHCGIKRQLYWNHDDCQVVSCQWAQAEYAPCATCRHRGAEGLCGLTHALLPVNGTGCCHHNAPVLADGVLIEINRDTLAMLGIEPEEPEEFVLIREGIPFQRDDAGRLWVNLNDLALPYIFGQGTEHLPDEEIDWAGWFEQWQ